MLERPKSRPQGAAEVEQDIRQFHQDHGVNSNTTRSIRNAFWRCTGQTGYLEAMYRHTRSCEACKEQVEQQLASYRGQRYSSG